MPEPFLKRTKSIIRPVTRGSLTQGVIFSCGIADAYPELSAHGIVITARCDLANDKTPIVNYLPIVPFENWLKRDARLLLAGKLRAAAMGRLRGILKESGSSPSLIERESASEVVDALFPPEDETKTVKAWREKCVAELAKLDLAFQARNDESDDLLRALEAATVKDKKKLIEELVNQNLAGYYFLNCVEDGGPSLGFVVVIREIRNLPMRLGESLAKGISHDQYRVLCESDHSFSGYLSIQNDDLAMPVGLVDSPHLEHIMQTFSILFTRIGLDDPNPAYIAHLHEGTR